MSPAFEKARLLILSLSSPEDASEQIIELQNLSGEDLEIELNNLYDSAPRLATEGKVKEISVMLRIFEKFNNSSHDRMLLNYLAQAEANQALQNSTDSEEMIQALDLISESFEVANETNEEVDKEVKEENIET